MSKFDFGMIGLGTMGRNLLLNMADHGFNVTGHDPNEAQVALLEEEGKETGIQGFTDLKEFVSQLNTPRAVMMLVPAGKIVDQVIQDLIPLLDEGDLIIDGGNTYYTDTDRRFEELRKVGIHFFGVGISGGASGARRGPSMMPGGDRDAYRVVKNIFEAVAAKVNDEPCVTYIGPGASGHFVKMVHNGIEYAMMQLISEVYAIMKGHLKMSNEDIQDVFTQWDQGRLKSFLIEITSKIFGQPDDQTEAQLIDMISDQARSKGTGKWTSQIAMNLQVPVPTIDMAVAMRDTSKYKSLREDMSDLYDAPAAEVNGLVISDLEEALYFSFIMCYAQGLHMLSVASKKLNYELDLAAIARIWRGGCIIRAALLEDIYSAFSKNPDLPHLLLDEGIRDLVKGAETGMRKTSAQVSIVGIGAPALTSALGYYDMLRISRMPSNLIQAQRDFFGSHTYERTDKEGIFHTDWE